MSNPLLCWEDRSVRGSVLRHTKCLAKRETRYKMCKLALYTHSGHTHQLTETTHTHSQCLSPSLYLFQLKALIPKRPAGSQEVRFVPYLWTVDDFFMRVKALPEFPVMLAHRGVRMVNLRLPLNSKGQRSVNGVPSMWKMAKG